MTGLKHDKNALRVVRWKSTWKRQKIILSIKTVFSWILMWFGMHYNSMNSSNQIPLYQKYTCLFQEPWSLMLKEEYILIPLLPQIRILLKHYFMGEGYPVISVMTVG